jgi:hypothetical protein
MTNLLPTTKSGWASIALGLSLFLACIAHTLEGNPSQAFLDLCGALGTLGLPAAVGPGWHVEIVKDARVDTSAPRMGGPS